MESRDALAPWAKLYSGVIPYGSKGRTHESVDCYGLVRLVLAEQFGIDLPDYLGAYADSKESAAISRAIRGALPEWVKVETPEPGDVVLAWQRSRRDWSHVGIYAGERQILHAHERNGYAVLEEVDSRYWHGRIVGYYRHPSRVVREPEVLPALPPDGRVAGYVTVAFLASPFAGTPLTKQVIAGPTIAGIVRDLGIVGDASGYIRVTHQDHAIDEQWWPYIRPKAGTFLAVRPVPGDPVSIMAFIIAASQVVASAAAGIASGALGALGLTGAAGSIGAGVGAAGALGIGAFNVGAFIGQALVVAGVSVGLGQLAKSVAAPSGSNPKTPTGPGSTRVGGNFGNEIRLYQPVPQGFGKLKIAPPFAARPWYEFTGDKRYLRALLLVGYGRHPTPGTPCYNVTDIRINDVPFAEVADDYEPDEASVQIITTTDGGANLITGHTGFADTIREAPLGPNPTFTTPTGNEVPYGIGGLPTWPGALRPPFLVAQIPGLATELEVHIEFPLGIYRLDELGSGRRWEVSVQIEYRVVGAPAWTAWIYKDYVKQHARSPIIEAFHLQGLPLEQYEVRIRPRWDVYSHRENISPQARGNQVDSSENDIPPYYMGSDDEGQTPGGAGAHPWNFSGYDKNTHPDPNSDHSLDTSIAQSNMTVHSIRGIQLQTAPVTLGGCTLLAIKIPSQAAGTITCVYERLLPVWDGAAFTAPQITRSAAWAALEVLRGSQGGNPRPVPDSKINLAEFKAWADRPATYPEGVPTVDYPDTVPVCSNVDLYVDYQTDTFSLFQQIAGLSFASLDFPDGSFGVVEDRSQTTPVGLITARNAQGFKGRILYQENPHALLVRYISADQGYQEAEITVYDDGYSVDGTLDRFGAPTTIASKFEEFRVIGLTEKIEVERHARIRMLLNRLRNEEWELTQFLDQLPFRRGKLVKFAHPVGLLGQRQYRVTKVTVGGGGAITQAFVEINNLVYESGKSYAVTWWRASSTDPFHKVVADRPVNNLVGSSPTNWVTFTTPVPAADAPGVGDLIAFGEVNLVTTDCIIRSISPNPGFTARVELIPATIAVFDNWASKFPPRDPQITVPPPNVQPAPLIPVILGIVSGPSYVQETAEGFIPFMAVTFRVPAGGRVAASHVQARIRLNDSDTVAQPWMVLSAVSSDSNPYLVGPVFEGAEYAVQLRSITALGVVSAWSASTLHTVEISTVGGPGPSDVTGLRVELGLLRWNYGELPLGFLGFKVRWDNGNTGGIWAQGEPAHEGFLSVNEFPLSGLPTDEQITVMVKAFDRFGGESDNAAYTVMNLADRPVQNVIVSRPQHPNWPGTKTACTVVVDALVPNASGADTVAATYRYVFTPEENQLGRWLIHRTTVEGRLRTRVWYKTASQLPFWKADDNALFWDLDGDGDVDAADDAALFWKPDEPFRLMLPRLRPQERIQYTIEVELKSQVGGVALGSKITEHTLFSDVPDFQMPLGDVPISEAGSRLPVLGYFDKIKSVTVTVQELIEGEYRLVQIVDRSAAGPKIRVMDWSGNGVSALVDALVVGIPSQLAFDAGVVTD